MIVAVIGLSAIMAVRIERRTVEDAGSLIQARHLAETAIELGFHRVANPDWRIALANGDWETAKVVGTGSYSLRGIDPGDANLADDELDPLVLSGIGAHGAARYELEVTLQSAMKPLGCLQVALQVGNDINLQGGIVNGDQIISANNRIVASGAVTVYPDMEAVNGFSGTLGPGEKRILAAPRSMPDPNTVFNYYLAQGTAISVNSLPSSGGAPVIDKIVLSPASNPFGPVNAQGIYVIDCKSQNLVIRSSRIVGTLVLLNLGAGSSVSNSVSWEPAVANFPALLAQGNMGLGMDSAPLSELVTGTNFNPPGTPYNSDQDTLNDDTYPSRISGIVYVSNDVASLFKPTVAGNLIVGNTLTGNGQPTVNYDEKFHDNPPPGFREPVKMVVIPGSWRRVVE